MIEIFKETNGLLVDLRQDISIGDDIVFAEALYGKHYRKIVMLIDVFGGDFSACLNIYETLMSLKDTEIVGIAKRAYSGGLVILLGCDVRIAAKREDWKITLHPVFIRKPIVKLQTVINNAIKDTKRNNGGEFNEEIFWNILKPDIPIDMQISLESILTNRTKLSHDEISIIMKQSSSTEFPLEKAFECGIINEISHV